MTTEIRRVALVVLSGFLLLTVNLHVVQLLRAADFSEDPRNPRLRQAEYAIQRGAIFSSDDAIARTIPSPQGEFDFFRAYPEAELFAHLTGWTSFWLGQQGLEDVLDTELNGGTAAALAEDLKSLIDDQPQRGNSVVLTVDPRVQAEARRALGNRTGAVVVLESRTGRVVAMYSNPSYDPNPIASQDFETANAAHQTLLASPQQPLLDRTRRQTYPPGSTFKLIVAATALETGLEPDTAFEDRASYTPPLTSKAITNFSSGSCGRQATINLRDALVTSCNTVFAELGVTLDFATLERTARRLGFDADMPFELATSPSTLGVPEDAPSRAQTAIGQRDVRVTPLHQAQIVSTIVNQGESLRPYVVAEIVDQAGRTLRSTTSAPWTAHQTAQALSTRSAALLREMMIEVVERGTGRRAAIAGATVGGKTGTAQVPDQTPTVWFVGFAEDGPASFSVAVVLSDAGEDATGGREAAPVAQAVLEAALGRR